MPSAGELLGRHLEASGRQDIDQLVGDYAEDAVVVSRGDVYRGRDEIREHFEEMFAGELGADSEFEMLGQDVAEGVATFTYRMETPEETWEFATDSLFVEDGKIAAHTAQVYVSPGDS